MDEKEIHLRDYLRIVNKRKGTIFTFFLLTIVTVIITTFTATPLYFTSTKIIIEQNTSDSLTNSYRYAPYDPEFLETQYQIIKSTAVVERVVESLNPEKMYDTFFVEKEEKISYINSTLSWFKEQFVAVKEMMGIKKLSSATTDTVTKKIPVELDTPLTKSQILVDIIKAGISVEPVANSKVVQIGFFSDNPAVAMKVANSIAQAYIDELIDMQMEVAGYSVGWMKKKGETQRINLEESEIALHRYKKKYDIITVEDRLTVLPERLSELSKNLTRAETKKKELFAIYNQIKNAKEEDLETIAGIAKHASVDSINKKISITDQKISELSKKYGPKHPKMITANNELKRLKNKKHNALKTAVQTIKNEYLLTKDNERDLRELLDQTKFQAERLGERSIQLGILQRKVDTNRYLYDALIKKIKEKGITEKSQTVNVWVIEKARMPNFPAKPKKKKNILLGIILGLFGGIGLAFFLEYLDNTVKFPEDIEEKLNIPVISTIDLFKEKEETIVQNVLKYTSSLIAENFKGLRTSIFLSPADNPIRTLLITSMMPGDGKSSVAGCLAASIAQTGKKVLLLDADMRHPTQHEIFNRENTSGLSSLLAGITKGNENIQPDIIENLDLITAGPIPPNPSELLSTKKFKEMLTTFSISYDMIIIDSPPLVSVTDPVILSQNVDGIIIVTWAGKTTYELLKKGLKQLTDVNAPITGLVLNRFSSKNSGYYYGYSNYYIQQDPE